MTPEEKKNLRVTACRVRQGIIEGTFRAKSGHPGGSLSAADVITYLYFSRMRVDPSDPDRADRDRFVLSKGHAAPALYSVLAQRGFFPVEEIKRPGRFGGGGHGSRRKAQRPGQPRVHASRRRRDPGGTGLGSHDVLRALQTRQPRRPGGQQRTSDRRSRERRDESLPHRREARRFRTVRTDGRRARF